LTDSGGASTKGVVQPASKGGASGVQDPVIYDIVEWKQTDLTTFFDECIDSMDKAIILGLELKEVGERCQLTIGKLANYVDKGKWNGGISKFAKGIGIPFSTVQEWAAATATPELTDRSVSLGTSKVAIIERSDDPEQVWEWIDEQETPPTKREIITNIREMTKQEPVPLPEGVFDIICGDPPWRYDFSETDSRAIENQYPTMTVEEIKELKIPSADNAVLFLCATAPKLREALEVMEAWGFEYKTHAIWDKVSIGMGYWFRGQHELLLVGTKGEFSPPPPESRVSSLIVEKRMGHSKKPTLFYEIIERMFPDGSCLELFARDHREGWQQWGNEI